ncbi:MAG TPA: hypothetical protein VJ865_13075 [Gemmatimonadaceae bacterium]|nr:hypothetical protein [Gemmatimonadaceae bacterium]
MRERTLNAVQVAILLVSTSCGIGFLLGTGELAMHHGMAGSLYAIATAIGLTALALCARRLWTGGKSVWDWSDQLYGGAVRRSVALLSLIWMTGVLAAQIRGGSSILALTGLPRTPSLLLIDGLLIGLSLLRLSWLAAGFAICMLGCSAILVRSLFETHGLRVWLHAPAQFIAALQPIAPENTVFTIASVVVMVICGADYQQFVLTARAPVIARTGCLLAAALVFVIGFLPASAVIAASPTWHLEHVVDPVQIVPIVLMHTLSSYSVIATRCLIITVLVTTALGAGCSILRAMSDATATFGPGSTIQPLWSRALPIALASFVAMRGQSLIDMMVDLNTVYIAAVAPLLIFWRLRTPVSNAAANVAMATGCGIALSCYLMRWMGMTAIPDAAPILFASPTSTAIGLLLTRRSKTFASRRRWATHCLPFCRANGSSNGQFSTSPAAPLSEGANGD